MKERDWDLIEISNMEKQLLHLERKKEAALGRGISFVTHYNGLPNIVQIQHQKTQSASLLPDL